MPIDADIALRRRRFDAARAALRARVEQLESEHRLILWIDSRAGDLLSLVPLPGASVWFPAFGSSVEQLSSGLQRMRETADYLDRLALWERAGVAEFRPSPTVPGDLDLWIDPAKVPEAPEALQQTTLGAGAVLAIVGIIAAAVGVGFGANVLIERERTERNRLDRELAQSILTARQEGTISAIDANTLLEFVTEWREKAVQEAKATGSIIPGLDDLTGLIKIGVGAAIAVGIINVILSLRRPE